MGQAAGCIYFAGADAIWLPNMSWFWTGEIGVDPSGSGLVPRAESGLQARCKKKEQPGNPSGSGIEAPAIEGNALWPMILRKVVQQTAPA